MHSRLKEEDSSDLETVYTHAMFAQVVDCSSEAQLQTATHFRLCLPVPCISMVLFNISLKSRTHIKTIVVQY